MSFGYHYDGAGRLSSLTNPFGETTVYAHQTASRSSNKTLTNRVRTGSNHNALGQSNALGRMRWGECAPSFIGMTDDGAGNRIGVTASIQALPSLSGTTSYTYDAKDQLTQEASTRAGGYTNNYAYDTAGNPTAFKGQSRTYNAKNQLTGGTGLAGPFTYDGNGNPTTYNGSVLSFNAGDRTTAFGTALTAGYNGGGLRVWKQSNAGGRTYFLYASGVPICEFDAAGSLIATNTWGPGGLVSRRSGNGSVFYTFDERGNTVQRTNGAGNVLSSRINDAFGTPGGSAGTGDPYDGFGGRYGYYTDSETGLQLCTFRYYDPNTGRWINRDPIGYRGGINLYAYCDSNPVMRADPLGLTFNVQEQYERKTFGCVSRGYRKAGKKN
ncbi:MAG: RHS repeat-associated core domain-containing protein [Fibrella sp.]|nr:RHS repeat-associated core domain-containing protein [Armatimonadota bacterium]